MDSPYRIEQLTSANRLLILNILYQKNDFIFFRQSVLPKYDQRFCSNFQKTPFLLNSSKLYNKQIQESKMAHVNFDL